jgi:hypothetical protein
MKEVDRYDPNPGYMSGGLMIKDSQGDWVKYEDYEKLVRKLKRAKKEDK